MTTPLVSPAWLREHRDDIVLLDASIDRTQGGFAPGSDAFAEAHIPGARFADLFTGFSDPAAAHPFSLPSLAHLRETAQSAGVRDNAPVVVYDRNGGAWAARVWWLLTIHGHPSVSVLDGGLALWIASGLPVESGHPSAPAATGTLTLHEPGPVTADLSEVLVTSRQEYPGQLVCALRREVYEAGHIPGSGSLPYAELLRADGTIDLDATRERGAALGSDAIVYCGGGINAAGLILALDAAGLPRPRLYDGSLTQWRADPSRPLSMGR
ncbi:thiosulfate/3-mercaptopyruvate sulfurtransferase [Actinoplanes lutulentus]|uniref:Thiosulfate/3-mercaptopyruvate sulfurtransferase n=1 Tax=Actinoplanes lutulentus TaxID=1287878 RepID=A0A327Z6S1_9ACTN|nr:rhodanese-like domain-containing protein [Actinoplanes lutulentus]MBB2949133.1 thiosulfate/3-mercaptopyruvate sulfurtransferase [Actinoplanes lutulentus]RAK31454.1 thiosulfate/3-mercaptopyruvate sulfurtransferase [Actinoplanes lutulentus]